MKKKNKSYEIHEIDKQILELAYKRSSLLIDDDLINRYNEESYIKTISNNKYDQKKILKLFKNLSKFKNKDLLSKKILYLGPKGSYTHDAAIKKFGRQNLFFSVNSISNLFDEVNKENADYAIVPIENSLNGLVNDTLNAFLKYNLTVVGEVILDIHHTFVSTCNDISKINKIYSKDIAFNQCSSFLEKYNLDDVEHVYVESTTKAAKLASLNPESAAICSNIAALNNRINVLFYDIEDNPSNKTRFFVLSKKNQTKLAKIIYKTSFIVELPNFSGSLINFLQDFKDANINLYKIKSHITKGVSNFFIEFDGHKEDKNIKSIFEKHPIIKIIGSYKKEVVDI